MVQGSSKRFVRIVRLPLVLEFLSSKALREMLVLVRLEKMAGNEL
jgi:hypothetical protein